MPPRQVAVACYRLTVREFRRPNPLLLGDARLARSAFDSLREGFQSLAEPVLREANNDLLRLRELDSDNYPMASALVTGGSYGITATGLNIDTLQRSYERGLEDAEVRPYLAQWHAANDARSGILLVQRFGQHGIVSPLRDHLREHFAALNPGHIMTFDPIVPQKLIDIMNRGEVKEVRVCIPDPPADEVDRLWITGHSPRDVGSLEVVFKPNRKKYLSWNVTGAGADPAGDRPNEAVLKRQYSGTPHEIRVTLAAQGIERTVALGNTERMLPVIVVGEDEVARTEDGNPDWDSLRGYCTDLIQELLREVEG